MCDRIGVQFSNGSAFFATTKFLQGEFAVPILPPATHTHTLELREERLRLFLRQLLKTVLFSWELCLSLLNDSLCWTKLVTVTVMNRLCHGMEELLCVGKWPLQQTVSAPRNGRKAVPTVHTEATEQMCWPGHQNPGELVACGYVSPLPGIGMTFLKSSLKWFPFQLNDRGCGIRQLFILSVEYIWCLFQAGKDWSYWGIECVLNNPCGMKRTLNTGWSFQKVTLS